MKKKVYVCAEHISSPGFSGVTPKEAYDTMVNEIGSTQTPEECYFLEGEVIQVECKIEKIATVTEVKVSK